MIKRYKEYQFNVNLSPEDDPNSYAEGYPYITCYAESLEKAQEEARDFFLDEGETLGELRSQDE